MYALHLDFGYYTWSLDLSERRLRSRRRRREDWSDLGWMVDFSKLGHTEPIKCDEHALSAVLEFPNGIVKDVTTSLSLQSSSVLQVVSYCPFASQRYSIERSSWLRQFDMNVYEGQSKILRHHRILAQALRTMPSTRGPWLLHLWRSIKRQVRRDDEYDNIYIGQEMPAHRARLPSPWCE